MLGFSLVAALAMAYMFLMVRTATAPENLVLAIQNEIRAVAPNQPVSNIQTMDEAASRAVPRFNVQLLGLFAAIAVMLSAAGVYGVTSHAVSQRMHEIGTRMALGARSSDILAMVIRETLTVATIAVAVGLAGALGLTRVIAASLFGVSATDFTSFSVGVACLLIVAVIASYVRARRAARINPLAALRAE